jgi:hypothetical protein
VDGPVIESCRSLVKSWGKELGTRKPAYQCHSSLAEAEEKIHSLYSSLQKMNFLKSIDGEIAAGL